MNVAFMFIEKYPNYGLALEVLRRITSVELRDIDTYVRVGLWGFDDPLWKNEISGSQQREDLAFRLVVTQQGNVWGLKKPRNELWRQLATEIIYVVQFNSIRRSLAFMLHERLEEFEGYLGFTQVLPHAVREHWRVFSLLPYQYKLEQGKIFVLFSEEHDNEFLADEILEWTQTHFHTLFDLPFVNAVSKKDIGERFSIFDASDHPRNELKIHKALQFLGDESAVQMEHAIYKALDIAPEAVEEIFSGISVLSQADISPAGCAQVAVNFRRCLEKLAEAITQPLTAKEKKECRRARKGEYKFRLEKYVTESLAESKPYKDYLQSELSELSTRIEKLYNLGNKGVHEDWLYHTFSLMALRLVLLVNDLLIPRRLVKPGVIFLPGEFEEE